MLLLTGSACAIAAAGGLYYWYQPLRTALDIAHEPTEANVVKFNSELLKRNHLLPFVRMDDDHPLHQAYQGVCYSSQISPQTKQSFFDALRRIGMQLTDTVQTECLHGTVSGLKLEYAKASPLSAHEANEENMEYWRANAQQALHGMNKAALSNPKAALDHARTCLIHLCRIQLYPKVMADSGEGFPTKCFESFYNSGVVDSSVVDSMKAVVDSIESLKEAEEISADACGAVNRCVNILYVSLIR